APTDRLQDLGGDPLELRTLGETGQGGETPVERHAGAEQGAQLLREDQQVLGADAAAAERRQGDGASRADGRRSRPYPCGTQAAVAEIEDDRALLAGLHGAFDDLSLEVGGSVLELCHCFSVRRTQGR